MKISGSDLNSKLKYFLKATRPKTLAAGIIPVCIGSAGAYYDGGFHAAYSSIALLCSTLIQIITNYINEIYDFKRGADTKERLGPQRAVASGLISVREMKSATILITIITFLLGMILVWKAGIIILIAGVCSLLFAYLYTGGKYPLAYKGISDIFVLIFFGIVAVSGTYYVQMEKITVGIFLAGLAPGLLSMNILGVNNIRDIETDRIAGKNTLAVRLGRKRAELLYILLLILAFIIPIGLSHLYQSFYMFLPLAALPFGIKLIFDLKKNHGKDLNKTLAKSGVLLLLFGILMSAGYILSK